MKGKFFGCSDNIQSEKMCQTAQSMQVFNFIKNNELKSPTSTLYITSMRLQNFRKDGGRGGIRILSSSYSSSCPGIMGPC